MTFDPDFEPPIARGMGPVPCQIPGALAQRLRSPECLSGGRDGACSDPMCLCTCHDDPSLAPDPADAYLARVITGLDRIINETPGSWDGFAVPPPFYPEGRAVSCPDPLCGDVRPPLASCSNPLEVTTLAGPREWRCGSPACACHTPSPSPDAEDVPMVDDQFATGVADYRGEIAR